MRVYEAKIVYSLISLGEDITLNSPAKVADYLRSAFDENPLQEAFYCVYLDRKNHPLGRHLISLGTMTGTLASPKEVFRGAILAGAAAMCVAHNLPSGDPAPSNADQRVTRSPPRRRAHSGDSIGRPRAIVGDAKADPREVGYFSFREGGLL
jgi:DNA repair protein RadC